MTDTKSEFYKFGPPESPFELEPNELLLKRNGDRVSPQLRGKDFELLVLLVKCAPRRITEESILRQVWPDVKGDGHSPNIVTNSIHHIRKSLSDDAKNPTYIEKAPPKGYRFIAQVETVQEMAPVEQEQEGSGRDTSKSIPIEVQTSAMIHPAPTRYPAGYFSNLDTIHVHVDGGKAADLVDNIVHKFRREGRPSKKNDVEDSTWGPQRTDDPDTYIPHTPGGTNENLQYFSTHLFGAFAETKRELHRLLSALNDLDVDEIVIEAERIIGKFGDEGIEWSNTYVHDYPALCSGDVGYENWQTKPIEIHYSLDIPRNGRWAMKRPLELDRLRDKTTELGIRVGGWFLFKSPNLKEWSYRSNMFEADVQKDKVEEYRRSLKEKIEELGRSEGFTCEVRALVEQTIGIWKTPLKPYPEPRSVSELSDWEAKYPNLRDFWVVTPNFLGDKEAPIQKAMIHNLRRDSNVTYTYFLRSIADYKRLQSLAEYLGRKLSPHVNVYDKIRAVMVLRDASDEGAFESVFERGQLWQGCFIANPIPGENGVDDADGYMLEKSKDAGRISGGRVMNNEEVKDIVKLLAALIPEGNRVLPLQGFCMPVSPEENKEVSGVTVVCIGLKDLPQLLNDVDDDGVATLLREYDLLVASETSKLGGEVVRSIETGYLLKFDKQNEALLCAKQIHKGVNTALKQRIAIDSGDVWRVMRAHGTDYCGKTITRCRELLKTTKYGEVRTTDWFRNTLGRKLSAELEPVEKPFDFEGIKGKIWKLKV